MRIEPVADLEMLARCLEPRFTQFQLEMLQIARGEGSTLIAAYDSGAILGCLQAKPDDTRSTYIEHLYVDSEHTRKKVASGLYDAISQMLDSRTLIAQVHSEFAVSIAFHDAYRRRIDPEAPVFTGGRWECSFPQRF